ncbi:MAG: helix-turn-helix domain-containing protein [Candidatus Obscuribacterales bacterium]|nr:helix-turn-helix domain-containing protein [Candidatus Obscuribacterales bacterium]
MPSSTIVPKNEQAIEARGVAAQLDAKKEEPFLTWADGTRIPLPGPLLEVLAIAAHAMQHNQGVTMVLRGTQLTTREAAELIGCSRQQVVDLIDERKLKGTKVGTHRRVQLADVLAFIELEDQERDKAISDLVKHTDEFGGYDAEWQEKPAGDKEEAS